LIFQVDDREEYPEKLKYSLGFDEWKRTNMESKFIARVNRVKMVLGIEPVRN